MATLAVLCCSLVVSSAPASSGSGCVDTRTFRSSVNDADNDAFQHTRYAEILDGSERALTRCRAAGDRAGSAYALVGIGNAERWLGRLDDAVRRLDEAIALFRGSADRAGLALALNDAGAVYEELNRFNEALRAHAEALALCRQLRDERGEAYALLGIGNAEGDLGRYDEAISALAEAQQRFRALRIADGFNRTLINLQNVRREAAAGIDQLRTEAADERNRTSLLVGTSLFVPDDYVATLLELEQRAPGNYGRQAFEIHERKTAREVLAQIAASAAQRFRGVPDALIAREQKMRSAATDARRRRDALLAADQPDRAAVAAAERAVKQADADLAELDAQTARAYPRYHELLHPQPVDLVTLQRDPRKGLRSGELMLIYDLLPGRSALWAIDRERIRFIAIPGREAIDRGVARLRAHLDRVLGASVGSAEAVAADDLGPTKYPADAYALYRMLVPGALASVVRDAKSLIVVPSGSLYLLAFESLVTRDPATTPPLHPRYLVDDVPGGISYVPSASLLATVRGAAAAGSRRDPLVAFANPAYPAPSADERGAHAHGRGVTRGASLRDIPRIPGTDREARAVFAELRRQPVAGRDLIEGDAATRDRVLALSDAGTLRRYRYLLFATHAVLPNEVDGVTLPSIVLAHPERGTAYGFLTVADILRLSLDADFVALSACNTGIEQPPSGDGISGLTRAFLYAGTPGISVTLWPVDDRAAPRITPPFFKLMNDGATPAAALRSAKLAMLRAPEAVFRHPYAWAPSVVFGDGDTAGARR